jgi:PAT family beta-lactamase induction signal transducer AmpG
MSRQGKVGEDELDPWRAPADQVDDRPSKLGPGYLALFAALYALQGVVVAYFINFNKLYMMAGGVDSTTAGDVQSLALVPFILKFLGGPISDRFNFLGLGHRKPYIVIGLVIQSLGLLGLSILDPAGHLPGFAALAVLTVGGLALYDTCCDGMVIDVTPPADRDRVQGLLVASRAVAATLGSVGFGLLLHHTGNGPGRGSPVLWLCAGAGLIPLVQALVVPEPVRAADAERFQWRALRVLILPRSLVLLAFGAFYATVGYGVEINLSEFYARDLRLEEGMIGGLGAARYIGRAVGAALLPILAPRLGRRWVLAVGLLGLAATTAVQATVSGPVSAGLAGGAFGAANGWTDAVFYVLAMEASDPRMAASTYALFMAVSNVSVLGGSLFSRLESALGAGGQSAARTAFLLTGAFVLLAWPTIQPLCRPPRQPEDVT